MLHPIVEPMVTEKGREVPNHFIVDTEEGKYYQGLRTERSIIAFKDKEGNITLDQNYWHYPNPIERNRERFLDEPDEATERKVNQGIYQLADLNRREGEDRRRKDEDEGGGGMRVE